MLRTIISTGWTKKYLVVLLLILAGCKKFVQVPPPASPIPSAVIFTNDSTAIGAITGTYSEMITAADQFTSSSTTIYAGMCADELYYYSPGARDEFVKNQLTEASHSVIGSQFWDRAYKYIYTANLCIEGLNSSTALTQAVKQSLMGECLFIRAFCYFYLVNLFGEVPLALSPDYQINAILPRVSKDEVYRQITIDLVHAQNLLPAPSADMTRIRPGKSAATALLARVYLYRGMFSQAETEATRIIDAGYYFLEPDLQRVFLATSREAIWQLKPVRPTFNTWEGNLLLPPSTTSFPTYLLTRSLIDSFATGDNRKAAWTASRIYQGKEIFYPSKYKVRINPVVSEYYMVLRFSEQYLIRAEARAKLNKLALASNDLDVIHTRAGLPGKNYTTQPELLIAIEKERRFELLAEWGHRWFDLKRTDRANVVLGNYKGTTWQAEDQLWPIPISQLNSNPHLKQNAGY